MPELYQTGNPSIEEWGGLWRSSIQDAIHIEDEEFDSAYHSLEENLARIGKVGFHANCDFYVLGDSYGDRTQDIQLVNPAALTSGLLQSVQTWIQVNFPNWRVVIPLCLLGDRHAIVIYKDAFRLPSEFESRAEQGIELIRTTLLRNRT